MKYLAMVFLYFLNNTIPVTAAKISRNRYNRVTFWVTKSKNRDIVIEGNLILGDSHLFHCLTHYHCLCLR